MLLSTESNCFPYSVPVCLERGAWYHRHRPTNTSFPFLNSGGWMGPAGLVLDIVDASVNFSNPASYQQNDQGLWHVRCLGQGLGACAHCIQQVAAPTAQLQNILYNSTYQAQMVLDDQCTVFQSLYVAEDKIKCDAIEGWFNSQTGTRAFIWHGNGGSAMFNLVLAPSFEQGLAGNNTAPHVVCPEPLDGRWCPNSTPPWQKAC